MESPTAHPNARLIERFYRAFAALDAAAMAAMWRMSCHRTRSHGLDAWALEFSDVQADARAGRAHWEARTRAGAAASLQAFRQQGQ